MSSDTQTIKDRIDIVQLIGEYVTLKKAGVNWKANCPFHQEKSPSFMVHQERQFWHCFGCGKSGDIFSFIQEMEGLEFPEALKLLAQRAGVTITTYQSERDRGERDRLLAINAAAANFFHHFLLEMPTAKPARDYLEKRKLTAATVEHWNIGWIPDQWDLLTQYLHKKGYSFSDLAAAGLTIRREGADDASGRGYYDRFRGRIMFPINDQHGNIVGFTGRVLVETDHSGGKYVNTPQTPLFDKSRLLYGLDKAKTEIKTKDTAVLVEGQMDVIACHQAGMTNVVAASGTALTPEQVKLLKRYAGAIAIAFDADKAGENAGKRGIGVALEGGLRVRVIQLPDGFAKDADECIKKDPSVWFKAVQEARAVMDWYFERTLRGPDRASPEQKQRAADILLPEIMRIPNGVEREEWLKKLGDELGMDRAILAEEAKKIQRAPKPRQIQTDGQPPAVQPSATDPFLENIGQELWALFVAHPEQYGEARSRMKSGYFAATSLSLLYETAENVYNKDNKLTVESLRQNLPAGVGENVIELLQLRASHQNGELEGPAVRREIDFLIGRLRDYFRKKRGREIQAAMTAAEKNGDKQLVEKLFSEFQSL